MVSEEIKLTRIRRPWYSNSTAISFYTEGEGSVTYSDVVVHEGNITAFPERRKPIS